MTEFRVEVVQIGAVERLPNSDSLSITQVHGGYPVIFRTGDFHEGDHAVYIPVDSVVPTDRAPFEFLAKPGHSPQQRIRAKRLRGTFSMGLLVPAPAMTKAGDDVQVELGVTKYEPLEDVAGEAEGRMPPTNGPWPKWRIWLAKHFPWLMSPKRIVGPKVPIYDIEGLRKYKNLLRGPQHLDNVLITPGEQVVLTEKIHGQNARYMYVPGRRWWQPGRFCVGSRTLWGRERGSNKWSQVARKYNLERICRRNPNMIVYGEIYGNGVQDLTYGVFGDEKRFCVFDVYDLKARQFLNHRKLLEFCCMEGLPIVPRLYIGPWSLDLVTYAEGKSTIPGANHVREGIVVKPLQERIDPQFGRVILKLHGEGYLTR